jgi:XTP/dITP diphosphohydrolase
MIRLVIATRNQHKVAEIQAILGNEFHYVTLDDFQGAPEVVEDARTFAGNATKKAVALAKWISQTQAADRRKQGGETFVLADDSGLEVDALGGAPGVHSARFAAFDSGRQGNSLSSENNEKLLRMLQSTPSEKRTARFRCVLALTHVLENRPMTESPVCSADEFELQTQLFDGTCEGQIIFEPRGNHGFGYDPLFMPLGYNQTFGELAEERKNRLSHRAKALSTLRETLASSPAMENGTSPN